MTEISKAADSAAELPVKPVTINQVVGYNMAVYRKAAGLTQEDLGQRLGGWTKVAVSAAERSWDGKRVRKFDADEIARIAAVLGIPLAALFLPPEGHGTVVRFVLATPEAEYAESADLVAYVFPAYEGDSPAMNEYRKRLIAVRASEHQPLVNLDTAARVLSLAQQTADQAIGDARSVADETLERARNEADEVLTKARRVAEQITGDARARAESLERDAQERHRQALMSLVVTPEQQTADQALADAGREADQILGGARREADEVLTKARRQAELITGDARARAESLEHDAQEQHRQAMMSLVVTREELERRVDDLRMFERMYRSRLLAYLEGQMSDLRAGITEPDGYKFVLKKGSIGKYYFNLVGANGQAIATSPHYERKQSALNAITSIRYGSTAEINDQTSE